MELFSMATVAMGGLLAITAVLLLCTRCTQQKDRRGSEHSQKSFIEDKKTNGRQHQEETRNSLGNARLLESGPDIPEASVVYDGRDSVSSSVWTPAPAICGGVDFCRQSYGYISPNSRGSQRTSYQTADGSLRRDVDGSNCATLSASTAGTIAAWRQEIEEMTGTEVQSRRQARGLSNISGASSDANYDTASDMSSSSDQGKQSILAMDKQYRKPFEQDNKFNGSGKATRVLPASVLKEPERLTFGDSDGRFVFAKPQSAGDGVDMSDTDDSEEYSVPPPLNTRNITNDKSHYQIPKLIMGKI